jgi:hypothetical protein
MKVQGTLKRLVDGDWHAQALGSEVGNIEASGRSKELALHNLREEITYRLEWCPCSSVEQDYVKLEVRLLPPDRYQAR